MSEEFKLGDLVWAKMKGFPAWPGMIAEPPKDKNKPANKKITYSWIYFFGTKNYSWIDAGNLKSYVPHKLDFKKSKSAGFVEACKAIEDVLLHGEASEFNPKATPDNVFDRLVNDSVTKTPKIGEPSGSKGKSSIKRRRTSLTRVGRRSSTGPKTDSSEISDSEIQKSATTPVGTRKRTKTTKDSYKSPTSKGKTDRHSSLSDNQQDSDASSCDYEDFQSTSSARPIVGKRGTSSIGLGRGKRSSSNAHSETKRYRSQNYSDADTTTTGWNLGGRVDYSSPMPKRQTASLLDRPPNISRPDTPPLDLNTVSQTLLDKNITPSDQKFGFIGLGVMGSGIVKNLLNSGHHVMVWNRSPEKSEEFKKAGAVVGLTPQDVVQYADITFSCVADPEVAKEMVFGNCSALDEINPTKSYVEMTTIDVKTSKKLSEGIIAKGGRYLEAQLQGSKQEAEEGTLIILSAGDRSLYNDCHSCFEAFGRSSFFLGEVGVATKMNLVIQLISGVVLAGLAESLALADKSGLRLSDVLEVIGLTDLNCPYILNKGKYIIECTFNTDQALTHMQKDLKLVLGISQEVDQPLPLTAAANEVFKHAKRLGYGAHDAAAVFINARF